MNDSSNIFNLRQGSIKMINILRRIFKGKKKRGKISHNTYNRDAYLMCKTWNESKVVYIGDSLTVTSDGAMTDNILKKFGTLRDVVEYVNNLFTSSRDMLVSEPDPVKRRALHDINSALMNKTASNIFVIYKDVNGKRVIRTYDKVLHEVSMSDEAERHK